MAVTLRCDGCIIVHTEAAIKQGASKDEIAEALGIAAAVNVGAALVYSTRVMDAFNEYPRGLTVRLLPVPTSTTSLVEAKMG